MSRWEAEARYEAFRQVAREQTQFELSGVLPPSLFHGVNLQPIDDTALLVWGATWNGGNFQWPEIVHHFRKDTDRFEVAVWKGEDLCGLATGRVSHGLDNVTVHFLERRPGHTPLKGRIAQIVLDMADNYAKILGKQRVKIKDPWEGAIPTYRGLGFSLAETIRSTTYYARQVYYEPLGALPSGGHPP
jgi:hypothetical protein